MSGPQLLSLPGSFLTPPATLPVAIDYPAALALRQMALVQDELPKYLLAPEISALLHYVPDLHRKMLLYHPVEHGRTYKRSAGADAGRFFSGAAISVRTAYHAQTTD